MLNAYNLKISSKDLNGYSSEYSHRNINYHSLREHMSDRIINMSDISKTCFPISKYNIFISHSHKDFSIAKKLANFLYENLGLSAFIDSMFWMHKDDVFEKIVSDFDLSDSECCRLYDSVNIEFCNAILQIINMSDIVFFLNTKSMSFFSKNYETVTNSPWIFYENEVTELIKKNDSLIHSGKLNEDINLEHKFNNSFVNLNINDLNKIVLKSKKDRIKSAVDIIADYEYDRYLTSNF